MSNTYDPKDNAIKSYYEGLQAVRLQKIRLGHLHPRQDYPDEMNAWRQYQAELMK